MRSSNLLELQCSVDYWSDQALEEAIGYLNEFEDIDWSQLAEAFQRQGSEWQTRCAESLSEVVLRRPLLFYCHCYALRMTMF